MPAGTSYWIEEGMLDHELRNTDLNKDGQVDHVCFTVRNQFLHPNHPLGWIRKLTVEIDGEDIPADQMYFVVRGQWISVEHMPTIRDIWWNMMEEAQICIKHRGLRTDKCFVTCSFEISLLMHASLLDLNDLWPRLTLHLTADMDVKEGGDGA